MASTPESFTSQIKPVYILIYFALLTNALCYVILLSFKIRLLALEKYGFIIHEFDPYFNYRATEYLYEHGWKKFATWFDYKVWYPLGRPVGTTIYPGMQVTAVFLKKMIFGARMSLNDICCLIPAWGGCTATFLTGYLAYECSVGANRHRSIIQDIPVIGWIYNKILHWVQRQLGQKTDQGDEDDSTASPPPAIEIGICAAAVMSMLPAHLMRSVGGGYDNESIAMTAMALTFSLWTRSLRSCEEGSSNSALLFGVLTGLAYFYMVAAWGGYVFVLNLIGMHAAVLVLLGRYSTKLYQAYTGFYIVGTFLATRVPVVGMTPLKSLEQLGPCAVFLGMQLLAFCEVLRKRRNLNRSQAWLLRIRVFLVSVAVMSALIYFVVPKRYFGPISSRVRGLFVKHTRTGNPLVDSVAEHQPASSTAYAQYLDKATYIAPIGFFIVLFFNFDDAGSFLVLYALVAYFFSAKMVRLILLLAPITSVLSGVALGRLFAFVVESFIPYRPSIGDIFGPGEDDETEDADTATSTSGERETSLQVNAVPVTGEEADKVKATATPVTSKRSKGNTEKTIVATASPVVSTVSPSNKEKSKKERKRKQQQQQQTRPEDRTVSESLKRAFTIFIRVGRVLTSIIVIQKAIPYAKEYNDFCWNMAHRLSHPTIIYEAQTNTGETIMIDDYREAYFWLRDNTPEDARIMAWWDYGYQITAMSNRTTIADGNTWNHEHIALLGRILTSPEKDGHRMARHLADYVLLWTGGGGDDLAKSPHLARIANSVFREMCPGDPTCVAFGMDQYGQPSRMMEASLLYKLHSHEIKPGVQVDPNRFKEAYTSSHGKVRIYKILKVAQESKEWVEQNRICDAPGSWFCRGQYPPGLQKYLAGKKDFRQLEDFNVDAEHDEEYQKAYFEHLSDRQKAEAKAKRELRKQQRQQNKKSSPSASDSKSPKFSDAPKKKRRDQSPYAWEDTDDTTRLFDLIASNRVHELKAWFKEDPDAAFARSSDGRGPMWWAYEYKREEIIKILTKIGVSYNELDKFGKTPLDLIE